jgi:glycosyltransferase involved in cell wall biosynthesis
MELQLDTALKKSREEGQMGNADQAVMTGITTIILTLNEEINVQYAIESARGWTDVLLVDSGSTDRTTEIANGLGARVLYNRFEGYASQRNWALANDPFGNEWVLFLDADEMITPELRREIVARISGTDCDGFYLKCRFIFMGTWIKHGGEYPTWYLRLFRKGKGVFHRDMNEHASLTGSTGYLSSDFDHVDRNGIGAWIVKHNRYAELEAQELVRFNERRARKEKEATARLFGSQAERKRWIREHVWNSLPPFVRPFFYFFYCYVVRLGFLDGRAGFIYRVLHGFWYLFLIDVKYIELRSPSRERNLKCNISGTQQ